MNELDISEKLHRTAKLFMDNGKAISAEEANQKLKDFQLCIVAGPDIASSRTLQASLLTVVNTGRRCFLGGVYVCGNLNTDLLIPWKNFKTLGEAVCDLQGKAGKDIPVRTPQIFIGEVPKEKRRGLFGVQATFDGWAGGVIPCDEEERLPEDHEFTPAGIIAGALAVSEAFQYVCGNVQAGRRAVGLSLWQPNSGGSWRDCGDLGPNINRLPSRLWIIGLGHLGQAFLWTLGFLPYAKPSDVKLFLQDHDTLAPANDSTSPLTSLSLIGQKKTRAMAEWCEERGFTTSIIERRFNGQFRLAIDEPRVALCGVDNPEARADLEDVGFDFIVEAGLGKGVHEYLAFQVHTFPGPQKAKDRWRKDTYNENIDEVIAKPAYSNLAKNGLEKCGIAMIAGRSVGASFVGTVVSAIVIAELLRIIHGGKHYSLIDGTLGSLHNRQVIENYDADIFNPGITEAIQFRKR